MHVQHGPEAALLQRPAIAVEDEEVRRAAGRADRGAHGRDDRRGARRPAVRALRRGRVLHTAVREPVHELRALSGRRLDGALPRAARRGRRRDDAARHRAGGARRPAGAERDDRGARGAAPGRAEAPLRGHVVGARWQGGVEAGAEDGGRVAEAGGRVDGDPPPLPRRPPPRRPRRTQGDGRRRARSA